MTTKVRYTPKQKELMRMWQHNQLSRLNLLEGSVSSGKTWISLVLWAFWVKTMPQDGLYMMCAKSLTTLKRNCLFLLQDQVGESNFKFSIAAKEGFLFGRRILFEGANDARSESKIRGLTLQGAYCDELTQFPEDFFAMLLSRLRMPGAKLFATTNPDTPMHWLKVNYIDRAEDLDFLDVKFTVDDNTELDKDYVANIKREYVGIYYDRFIMGKWAVAEGLIYPMYDNTVTAEPRDYTEYYISMDYGILNATAMILWGLYNGVWYAVREYYHSGRDTGIQKTDEQYYNQGLVPLAGDLPIKAVIIDPSAASFITLVRQKKRFKTIGAANEVLAGIQHTAGALAERRILVNSCCKNLIREVSLYVWDDNTSQDTPIKENDHCLTGETLVETVEGRKPIKELVGETGCVWCAKDGRPGKAAFHDVRMTQSEAEVFEIELENGLKVKATADHPVLTKRGWVQVKDLRSDDEIACIGGLENGSHIQPG